MLVREVCCPYIRTMTPNDPRIAILLSLVCLGNFFYRFFIEHSQAVAMISSPPLSALLLIDQKTARCKCRRATMAKIRRRNATRQTDCTPCSIKLRVCAICTHTCMCMLNVCALRCLVVAWTFRWRGFDPGVLAWEKNRSAHLLQVVCMPCMLPANECSLFSTLAVCPVDRQLTLKI